MVQHVVDSICAEGDADAGNTLETEDARQVVVAPASGDAPDLDIQRLDLEDGARVVIQAARQREVQFQFGREGDILDFVKNKFQFLNTFHTRRAAEDRTERGELFLVCPAEEDDRLQLRDGFLAEALVAQLGIHIIQSDFVQLIDSDGDIHQLISLPDDFRDAREDFAVIHLDADTDTEAAEHFVHDLDELHLVDERVRAYDVAIALIELAVTAFLRAVGAPNRLNLVSLEGKTDFVAMLDDEAGKGDGEVVAEAFFAGLGSELRGIHLRKLFTRHAGKAVAGVEDFEEEFVSFFAVFAHEGGKILHRGSFNLLKTIEVVNFADGVEDVVALRHFFGREVARTFRNGWFLHDAYVFELFWAQR